MISISTWKKAWAVLDARERRDAWTVLGIVTVAALSSAAMVGSVVPFLAVLANPDQIHEVRILTAMYTWGNFSTEYSFLVALGAGSLCVIIAANILQIVRTWAVARFSLLQMHHISYRLLSAYLYQPYEFFLNNNTAEMSAKILSESQEVVNQFFRPAGEVAASLLTIVAILLVLLWIDARVTFAAFFFLGGIYGATYFLSRRLISREGGLRAEANHSRYRLANEALGGVKDIKLLGREAAYVDRYKEPSRRMADAVVLVQVLSEIPQYVMQAVGFGGIIVLCLVLLDPHGLSSGVALGGILPLLGVFAFAGQRLLPELSRLYRGIMLLNYSTAAIGAVHRDLATKGDDASLMSGRPSRLGLKKDFMLERISYSYPQSHVAGLIDITVHIRSGEKIGIVGSTGAGKTTLADIVLGLLIPTGGRIVVDGVTITPTNLRAWQQTVGYVPQEIFLTDASVAENIALGLNPEEIDVARLHRAARIAQVDRFIREELELGYDTIVGERGVRLSGGQRQRIGIARALYHDADLFVFDEATSALDNLTEAEVMSAVESLPGEKTVLMIAHRLSTVRRCDRILVLDNGRLVGCDTWEVLMRSNSAFQRVAHLAEFSS